MNCLQHEVMKKWWKYMKDIMETNEDNSPVDSFKRSFLFTIRFEIS